MNLKGNKSSKLLMLSNIKMQEDINENIRYKERKDVYPWFRRRSWASFGCWSFKC